MQDSITNNLQVEIDVENHLLGTTVTLSDGTTGKVFSRGPRNESNMFLYNCHLCSIPNLPGERCLQTHIGGRKHQTRLALPSVDAEAFRQPLQQKNKSMFGISIFLGHTTSFFLICFLVQMNIAPGEPVPPGFENEVKAMAEIQKMLDVYKEQPLVALEYLAELNMGPGKAISYHCILCDKRGDSHTIIAHMTSQTHRQRFLVI
jgi:zinc finger CCCH domain-containing protein 13